MNIKTLIEAKSKNELEYKILRNEVISILKNVLDILKEKLELDKNDNKFVKIFNTQLLGKKMSKEELINLSHTPERALNEKEGFYECSFMILVGNSLMDDLDVVVSGIIISKDLMNDNYTCIFTLDRDKTIHLKNKDDRENLEEFVNHIIACLHKYYTDSVKNWLKKFDLRKIYE